MSGASPRSAAPPALIDDAELRSLHESVERALDAGSEEGLAIIGWGEISLGVGWPAGAPRLVAKRMPVFPSRERFERYAETVRRYIERLAAGGVECVATEVRGVDREDGVVAYCVQPLEPADTLGPRVLAGADPHAGHPLVEVITGPVPRVVDARTGLDAQLANWSWDGERARYIDVTTPFMRDSAGRDEMDFDVLVAAYPAALRGVLRRWVAPSIIAQYHDRRVALLDALANLVKERLEDWLPAFVAAANVHLDDPLSEREVHRYYRSDARTWRWIQRVRRADRAWHRLRGRSYPYLLPGHIDR